MEIELTAEHNDFIRLGIEQGRYRDMDDAVHQAMELWLERERRRLELLASLDEAADSIEAGEYIELDSEKAIVEMMEGVKRRGRQRVAATGASKDAIA